MPYRNGLGAPKFIYRIDSRPPEEIFNSGFQTWGSNNNFFQHILGYSLGDDIPEEYRSGIISASDSPDSSLRFFGSMLRMPEQTFQYYLYEIRADANVYSAQRTASFYNQRISTASIEFEEEGDLDVAIDAVDAIAGDFAYQREWFNVGSIPAERVRSAWRVDSVPINPQHIRHQRGVHYTPRIDGTEILNQNYRDENTFANELPYTEGTSIVTPSRVSIPTELVEADASGGVGATLGFACSPSSSPPHSRDKRSLDNKVEMVCYFDKCKVKRSLKKYAKPYIFGDALPFKMYLKGSKTKKEFLLSSNKSELNSNAMLVDLSQTRKAPEFIYDCFQCLTWNPNKEFCLALTPVYAGFQDFYNLNYKVATVNDELQKWTLQIVKNQSDEILLRILSQRIQGFSIQRDCRTNQLSLRPMNNHDANFEELYIVISQNRCDDCVLLPQEAKTKLVDLQLSWFYQNQNYVMIPETGLSKPAAPPKNTFFYDLKSYKIIYIDNRGRISALFNDRNSHNWNWARWVSSNLKKPSDKRLKWYFVNLKWKDTNDLNYRNIMSFDRNDFLRVVVSGINWGKIYTTPLKTDINSIALFRINPDADV